MQMLYMSLSPTSKASEWREAEINAKLSGFLLPLQLD